MFLHWKHLKTNIKIQTINQTDRCHCFLYKTWNKEYYFKLFMMEKKTKVKQQYFKIPMDNKNLDQESRIKNLYTYNKSYYDFFVLIFYYF